MIWGEPLAKEAVSVSSSGSYDLVHSIIWLTSTFLWCSFWVPRSHPLTQPLDTTLSGNFHTSQSPSKILLILQSPVQTSCSLCSETDKHSAVSFKTEWVCSKRKNSRFSLIIIFILIWSPQPYCTFLEHRDHIFLYFWSLTWSLAQENWVNINSESVSGVGCGLPRATEMFVQKLAVKWVQRSGCSYHHTRHQDSSLWNLHSHCTAPPLPPQVCEHGSSGFLLLEGLWDVPVTPGLQLTNGWVLALSSECLLHLCFTQD